MDQLDAFPKLAPFPAAHLRDFFSAEAAGTTGVAAQTRNDLSQGCFAAAGFAHNTQGLSSSNRKIDISQNCHGTSSFLGEGFAKSGNLNYLFQFVHLLKWDSSRRSTSPPYGQPHCSLEPSPDRRVRTDCIGAQTHIRTPPTPYLAVCRGSI